MRLWRRVLRNRGQTDPDLSQDFGARMASKAGAGYEEIARRGRALSTSSTASSGCNSLSEFAFEMELDGWKHSEGWVPDSSSNARHVRESWQQTERGRSNADTVPSNDPAKISATIKSKSEATASLEAHMRLPDPIPTGGGAISNHEKEA